MAQTKNKSTFSRARKPSSAGYYAKRYLNMEFIKDLLYNPKKLYVTCWGLLIFEVFLNIFIVQRVKYTEIDWTAYMQEVGGFLNGTLDYTLLKGDTGPLVYPAGFVYIYSVLYYITSQGENIRFAQYIFLILYLCQLYVTFEIYCKTQKVPPYALILTTLTSYRIHSIYVLRLFNDPFAVFFFYISLSLFIKNRWVWGSVFYSFAVSIKMNILLYSPCLLLAYLTNLSYYDAFLNLFVCGAVQLILGLPFLYANFWGYIKGSFDLGRVFEHKWTVNYRFLSRELFENKTFHISLLIIQVSLLILFYPAVKRYLTSYYTLRSTLDNLKSNKVVKNKAKIQNESKSLTRDKSLTKDKSLSKDEQKFLDAYEKQLQKSGRQKTNGEQSNKQKGYKQAVENKRELVENKKEMVENKKETVEIDFATVTRLFVLPFFVTNFIGIACARSLHYQFYSWYFHSLLYLVHSTPYRKPVMFLILALIEFCWNTYPSTELSSCLLHVCHCLILYGVYNVMNQK